MKILFIHQNFPGQFKHLAPAMAALGHEVVALGINRPAHPSPGVQVILYQPKRDAEATGGATPGELRELETKIVRGRSAASVITQLKDKGFIPDVVCAHSGWGEALFIKDVLPEVPLLVYAEYYYGTPGGDTDFDPEFTRTSLRQHERLRLKNTHLLHSLVAADAGLAPTRFQRDRHPPLLRDKIRVIHDGIDTRRFRPDDQAVVSIKRAGVTLRRSDEVVTFIARELEPYRGYHSFMRALPELMRLRPKAQIVIVGGEGVSYGAAPPAGSTWKDIFLNEVAGAIDQSRLHFVGKVPHEVLTQLLQVSTVHVYLTYPFVLSWSLMEAMSIGCLIVGSRTAPVEEVIEHGRTGLLTDFFDPDAIARTVADAIVRRDELLPLRAAARQFIVDHYDLQDICLPAQIRLLEELAGQRSGEKPQ